MEYPIEILKKSESVLMRKISRMKDGKPRNYSVERLNRLREAIKYLQQRYSLVDNKL
jgi:archaellum component FlaC